MSNRGVNRSYSHSLSITARVGLGAAALTVFALLIAAFQLTLLFFGHVERRFEDTLRADLLRVVSDVLTDPATPPRLGPAYDRPFSGWSWQIRDGDVVRAQSRSLGPVFSGGAQPLEAPRNTVRAFDAPDGARVLGIAREVTFDDGAPPLLIAVAGPVDEIEQAAKEFRSSLLLTLAVIGFSLIALVLIAMRIALRPLKDLRRKVVAMRSGGDVERSWPRELSPVTTELDALRAHSDRLVERARGEAGDFAHAVKTPLAVLHQLAERAPNEISSDLSAQIRRIDEHLARRLSQSRAVGRGGRRAGVRACVDDLVFALARQMEERNVFVSVEIEPGATFAGDETDLYEMLGNLMDNASKWAARQVSVTAFAVGDVLEITVLDDGPGIPADRRTAIFRRGARLDEKAPGQGLGLPIVRDIAALYGGRIEIEDADANGVLARLYLPLAPSIATERNTPLTEID